MIKNILFDMGNVLIRFEPNRYVKNAGLSLSLIHISEPTRH